MADRKKLNNLVLRVSSKTLIHSMLARNVKGRLHEKMGNLTFVYPRKLLIISSIAENSTCRLFKKSMARTTIRQNDASEMQQCLCELHLYMDG